LSRFAGVSERGSVQAKSRAQSRDLASAALQIGESGNAVAHKRVMYSRRRRVSDAMKSINGETVEPLVRTLF
jgi:hypothetical protein